MDRDDPSNGWDEHTSFTEVELAEPEEDEPVVARRLHVLIVDDDKTQRAVLRRALRLGGLAVDVEEANDGGSARAHLIDRRYDCVLLASALPDGTALTLLPTIRTIGLTCPIVVLTKRGEEQAASALLSAGATDCLTKSLVTPKRLAHAVRNALRIARAERERAQALQLERRARGDAESAQRRLAYLAEASAILSSSLEYSATLENVARLCVPNLADWCFVDLLEEDGSFMRMAVAHADPAQAELARRLRRRYANLPDAPCGVSRVIATGRSEVINDAPDWLLITLARDAEHLELLRELKAGSLLMVPLVARGRTLGAMTLVSHEPSRYGLDDVVFAEEIARRAGLAVDNALLFDHVKKAEERLRHQLDFTTAITGSLAEGVCALDLNGRIAFVNPAAETILGFGAGDLLGRSLETLTTDPSAVRAISSGNVLRVDDDRFVGKHGHLVPVSYAASPIVTDGAVIGTVLVFHDASGRKRAEAELEASRRQLAQAEKLSALGTLVSGVAHELRTPLTYLTNNIFLLQARIEAVGRQDERLAGLVGDVRRFSQAAMEGVDRINALVRDLRPFAKTEAGRRVEAGLHEVVAGAVDLFRATQRGRVEMHAHLEPTPPLSLDRGQVQRVVINLLLNAAEAMPHGGYIRVSTRSTPTAAILEIEDEGGGIPPSVEGRIFDPFYTTKADGTGLGLAITRRIVESHRGSISYRTSLGRGTTFTVTLPHLHEGEPRERIVPVADDSAREVLGAPAPEVPNH